MRTCLNQYRIFLFAILIAGVFSFAQETKAAAEEPVADEVASEEVAAENPVAEEPVALDFVAAETEDVVKELPKQFLLAEDLQKICKKKFCAVEVFIRNDVYEQMSKSKSPLSVETMEKYDASHPVTTEKESRMQAVEDEFVQMCKGKEFCIVNATIHMPSFTIACAVNSAKSSKLVVPKVLYYQGVNYSTDSEVLPFELKKAESPPKETSTPVAKPLPLKKKKSSHGFAFSIGVLPEETYGEINTNRTDALEFFPRYIYKRRLLDNITLAVGAGVAFRINELDLEDSREIYVENYNSNYYYNYVTLNREGYISYSNMALDFPVDIRFGSLFFGSLAFELRKPFCEWYDYEVQFNAPGHYAEYENDDDFNFFEIEDAEIGFWLGLGVATESFGVGLQFMLLGDATSGSHEYLDMSSGTIPVRLSLEFAF